jgi:hypothetical protein
MGMDRHRLDTDYCDWTARFSGSRERRSHCPRPGSLHTSCRRLRSRMVVGWAGLAAAPQVGCRGMTPPASFDTLDDHVDGQPGRLWFYEDVV